jgi:hypothetical protein
VFCHPEPFGCHSEPFVCHSERSEESQGKLREESQDKLREGSRIQRLRYQRFFGSTPQNDIATPFLATEVKMSGNRGESLVLGN